MNRYGPDCHERGIRGYGNPDEGVVIVGIAPGKNEMKIGRPLVGQSGELLDAVLEAAGWSRDKCYCTNLICWYNNEPSPSEIDDCSDRLHREILEAKPKLIVTLGKLATEHFVKREMGSVRGCPTWNDEFNCWVLPTWHPATFLHGYDGAILDIAKDLSKIVTVRDWPKDIANFHYDVCQSTDDAQRKLNALCSRGSFVAIDVETDNKNVDEIDVFDDRFLCASVSDGDDTITMPYEVFKKMNFPGANISYDESQVYTIRVNKVRYTFHNGMFDTQAILKHTGIDIPIVEDTMLMSYALDERQGTHRLKQLVREYVGAGFYETEIEPYKKKGMSFAPENVLYRYNAADACYTARLASVLYPMMIKDNVEHMYKTLLIPAANRFKYIQLRGVHVDRAKIYKLGAEWTQRWLEDEQELVDMATAAGLS